MALRKTLGGGLASLVGWHVAVTLPLVTEFILLQAVAVGITTVIYSLIPTLDTSAQQSFEDWRKVFQVVSPTVTISGGVGIVLSSILFARQAQVERQNAEAARAEIQAAQEEARVAKALADERAQTIAALQTELGRITERLERLENGKG